MLEVFMAHASALFPVGYHDLHPDVALNYQLNRFWNWVGEPEMLDELRRVAPNLTDYSEWVRQLLALGEQALAEGRMLAGAYLIRASEFFMSADDPRRREARRIFLDTVLTEFGVRADQHHDVAYGKAILSAYRLTPAAPTGSSWSSAVSTATSRNGYRCCWRCAVLSLTSSRSTVPVKALPWKPVYR
jgi:hypothetical protein